MKIGVKNGTMCFHCPFTGTAAAWRWCNFGKNCHKCLLNSPVDTDLSDCDIWVKEGTFIYLHEEEARW